jgi:hypothetical protein
MQATGWKATKEFSRLRGYAEFGLGSYLNSTGSFGYRFIDTPKSTLGVWLQHNSSTAFHPSAVNNNDATTAESAARKYFDENIGLYGSTQIEPLGLVGFDLTYHLGYYNYYTNLPYTIGTRNLLTDPYTQTLNDVNAQIWLASTDENKEGLSYQAAIADRYFGYRRFYTPTGLNLKPAAENNFQISGNVAYRWQQAYKAGLDLKANIVGYSTPQATASQDATSPWLRSLSTYEQVSLTPNFTYTASLFSARIGARVDLTFGAGKEEENLIATSGNYSTAHIAPDVALGVRQGKFAATLTATGGSELHTLAANSQLDNYQATILSTTTPTFTPLNGRLSIELGSFAGLKAHVAAAYKVTHNITPGLTYPLYLSQYALYPSDQLCTMNVKGVSLQAGASYTYTDLLHAEAQVSYQPQNGTTGYFNGYDRPRWLLDATTTLNPISELAITLAYQYRGVRNIYFQHATDSELPSHHNFENVSALRLPDVTNLSLEAAYTFSKRYTISLKADNLLSTAQYLNPVMPGEGLNIMGKIAVLF